MSYILDALNKSERERREQQGPTLQSIQRPRGGTSSHSGWFWIACTLSVVLVASVSGFFWLHYEPTFDTTGDTTLKSSDQISTLGSGESVADAGNKQSIEKSMEQAVPAKETTDQLLSKKADSAEIKINTTPILQEFSNLPDPVKQQIPALTFSFHVFSNNSERRTIIANGLRVREGNNLSKGLVLEEITVGGVILNWQDSYRFTINVVDKW